MAAQTAQRRRVGYFGGSFDPPHRGHLAVAEAARDHFCLSEVLLAPAGVQPLKPAGSSASFVDRLAMVRLLCDGLPGLSGSDVDAPREDLAPNYTIDTLLRLISHPEDPMELFVIVGADAFLDLPRWRDPARLLTVAEWVVVSRPGFSKEDIGAALVSTPLAPQARGKVHLLEGVMLPVSATEVRQRLEAGESCEAELTPAVREYIRLHHLYRP